MSLIFSPAAAATDNTAITTTTINTSSTSNPTTGSPTTADPATNDPNTVDRPTAPSYALAHSKPLPNLPPELWLEIIPRIPYSPSLLPTLRLTHPNLTLLTSAHQQTLTSALLTHHFPSRTTLRSLFPDLKLKTYAALATLYTRLQALDALGGKWLQITSHGPDLHWLKGKWEGLHRAGLLLLWRLRDVSYTEDDCNSSSFGYGSDSRGDDHSSACTLEAYEKKLALLRALPLPSLACLLFKLVSCVRILRVLGPEPWFSCGVCRHGACEFLVRESGGDVGERKHAGEAELVVQECLLEHGPEVFGGLLASEGEKKGSWARRIITNELARLPRRQLPFPDGSPKPVTLLAALRRTLAEKAGVCVCGAEHAMWEVLSRTGFDVVGEGVVGGLVRGEVLAGELGEKRMGI